MSCKNCKCKLEKRDKELTADADTWEEPAVVAWQIENPTIETISFTINNDCCCKPPCPDGDCGCEYVCEDEALAKEREEEEKKI